MDPIFDQPPSGARSLECNEHLQILDSKCDEDFAIRKLFHTKIFTQKCPLTCKIGREVLLFLTFTRVREPKLTRATAGKFEYRSKQIEFKTTEWKNYEKTQRMKDGIFSKYQYFHQNSETLESVDVDTFQRER